MAHLLAPLGDRRVFRRSTKTVDLEFAKELLIGFAGQGQRPPPTEPHWLQIEDALALYAQHLRGRPSYPLVQNARRALSAFCKESKLRHVSQLTLEQQDRYVVWRQRQIRQQGRIGSAATLNRDLGILRAVLRYARRCGRIIVEPHVQLLPEPPPRQRVLSLDECRQLLDRSRSTPHLHLFIKLALFTLQRSSAILGLQTQQVDLARARIDFHPPGTPLTAKRHPVVPIANAIWPDLFRAIQHSQTCRVIDYQGVPVESVKRSLGTLSRSLGIETVTPQALRRTAATLLAGSGVPMRQVAGMLGHSQIRTIERYAQHAPEYLADAAEGVNTLFGGAGVR